jgi:hypothetical protein
MFVVPVSWYDQTVVTPVVNDHGGSSFGELLAISMKRAGVTKLQLFGRPERPLPLLLLPNPGASRPGPLRQ